MIEFPNKFAKSNKMYGWINPNHNPSLRYLNTKGKEVPVSLVTKESTITDPNMIGVGEVIFCTVDVYGKPRHIPLEVQEWIKAVQEEDKSLGYYLDKIADLAIPIEQTITSLKELVGPKGPCTVAYYGTGDCTCGNCRIFKSDTRNNSYGYRPGEIK